MSPPRMSRPSTWTDVPEPRMSLADRAPTGPTRGNEALRSWNESVNGRTAAIVGLGYVGLPLALGLLDQGWDVIGVDVSLGRISAIRDGDVDLLPADLARLATFVDAPTFPLTTCPRRVVEADTVIICVPTPVDEHLVPDLRPLSAACASVVEHATAGQTIVLTSTSYVGTTRDLLVQPLVARGLRVGKDIFVAFSPERIDPGNAEHLQEKITRVVGGVTTECTRRTAAVLRGTVSTIHEVCSPEAAEMSKLLENTFRAVNIALANEFADACRHLGLEPMEIIRAAETKPYGFMPFYPGPGVGGQCIPCDPHYLLWQLRAQRLALPLIDTAMTAIAARPGKVTDRARELLADTGRGISGARVLIVGITYKPGVADTRASPALEILHALADAGAHVLYTDPLVPSLSSQGLVLVSEDDPGSQIWDLVLVHALHPGMDVSWLPRQALILDASYRLTNVEHPATL